MTFPERLEDWLVSIVLRSAAGVQLTISLYSPAYLNLGGESATVLYGEGVFVSTQMNYPTKS